MNPRPSLFLLALAASAAPALAQTLSVDPVDKWSWAENLGWMNWRDAGSPAGSQGCLLTPGFMSGFVWLENAGWLNLGDGSPANGAAYANASGVDFGVNLDADTGNLSGLAWGENIGWVNFSAAAPLGEAFAAKLLFGSPRRLHGFAWGENVGWINLGDASRSVAFPCPVDFNGDGFLDFFDYDDFVSCFESGVCPPGRTADFNGDSFADFFDYDAFVAAFEMGC